MVIMLIAVITSMALPSLGDPAYDNLKKEASRLHLLINMAREESMLRSEEWALEVTEQSYRFSKLEIEEKDGKQTDKLTPITKKIYRERRLPEQRISIEAEDSGAPITITEKEKLTSNENEQQDVLGVIWFLPSDEISTFEITLSHEFSDDKIILKLAETGEVIMQSERETE